MLWLQHDLLNRHHNMPNFHRDELFLQHDLNRRNTIYFFMHKTALACHMYCPQQLSFISASADVYINIVVKRVCPVRRCFKLLMKRFFIRPLKILNYEEKLTGIAGV